MNDTRHRPLWFDSHARLPYLDVAPGDCALVIVGAGVAGISLAYHAAEAGISCCVLEERHVASRASGRNDGQVLLGLGEYINRLIGQFGRERALELWHFLDTNHELVLQTIEKTGIDCDLHIAGGLRLAENDAEDAELRESAEILAAEGVASRFLDADAVRGALPLGQDFKGGLFLEREAIFDPFRFVHGLAEHARSRGAAIREGHRVTKIDGDAGDYTVRCSNGESVRCQVVVHASAALSPQLDRSGFLEAAVFPFRGQILATEELPDELAEQMPMWAMSSNFCNEYFRIHDRRLTLGGMRWAVPGEETGITDDSDIHADVGKKLRAWLGEHFPELAKLRVEREWTGIMAGTKDGLPLVGGLPGRTGEYACLAFNGYGMSFAFLAGKSVIEMIVEGRATQRGASMFRPDRFA